MDSNEEWRPVVGYEGRYEVSSLGRVRTVLAGGRYRYRAINEWRGRLCVTLGKGNVGAVHVMVAAAFLGPRPEGLYVCHNNGDPSDNRVTNLRYDTPSANQHDRVRHGRHYNAEKDECIHGHPFNDVNTYVSANGWRYCRPCKADRERERKHRLRAA